MTTRLIVTIDTECDKQSDWHCRQPLSFDAVEEGVGKRLQPLFDGFGIRPVYFLSPEVLCHRASMDLLRSLPRVELAAHLHGDFVVPEIETWEVGGSVADDMQCEYGADLEGAKMATLTEMFTQQVGRRPVSFRAGRFGVGRHTGRILADLGYAVDSSITPHIAWTDKRGEQVPDFLGLPEWPYVVGSEGHLWRPGSSPLLEVPVTVLAPGALPGRGANNPVWFRPWYSDAGTLCDVVDYVLAQPPYEGVARPLVMMFHNVEVMAGCSPYPQTAADVDRFLDQLKTVFDHAARRGVQACTLAEYAEEVRASRVATPAPVRRFFPPELRTSPDDIAAIVDRHEAQPWFKYISRERTSRWDVWQPCVWVAERVAPTASVLSIGCGIGLNLLWYAEQGFSRLEGFDVDPKAVAAARELASTAGSPARFWIDDAMNPSHLPTAQYDVIEALNCTMYMDAFTLDTFLATYVPLLADDGVLIYDAIDASYNGVADNQYATPDLNKPVNERRPSEYLTRLSEADVIAGCRAHGLVPAEVWRGRERVPRRVFALRRAPAAHSTTSSSERPRVLIVADVPNWIFERHARTLCERLGDEFDFTVVFKGQPFDEDAFDLIYPLEWWLAPPQQIRTPAKYVTGIRSHCSWDRGRFDALTEHLSTRFHRVHVVSERLRRRFAPHVPEVAHISHGVDTQHFTATTCADQSGVGQVRLGWAGNRFSSAQKGFAEIIEPLGRIPGVSLVFCGYSDRNLTMAEMREFYDSIDVYVCASDFEGNNNSLLEAASMCRAILTTDNGAVREYLRDGESALIVRRALPAFTQALVRLRDDPAFRARLGTAAGQSVRARFDWNDRAEDYRAFFREALANRDRDFAHAPSSAPSVCRA